MSDSAAIRSVSSDLNASKTKRVVVGITGASGAAYAQKIVSLLVQQEIETHLVVSPLGQRLLHDELGIKGLDLAQLAGGEAGGPVPKHLMLHAHRDVGAQIASGSFQHDGMVVVPCSANTLSAIATGQAQNLLHRAAYVTLKERRKLVLVHREAPLTLTDIRNMEAVTLMGGIVSPANPGFYMNPTSLNDLVEFVAGRALDLIGVEHQLGIRWKQENKD